MIGTRFHSVIFSLTSYVPAIGIEYEHKTSGIMKDLELEKWVIKMEEVNAKNLSSKVDELIAEKGDYRKHLKRILPSYIEQTNEPIKIVQKHYNNSIMYVRVDKSERTTVIAFTTLNRAKLLLSRISFQSS